MHKDRTNSTLVSTIKLTPFTNTHTILYWRNIRILYIFNLALAAFYLYSKDNRQQSIKSLMKPAC